jgi:alpha-D-xyloside xylohydrolase
VGELFATFSATGAPVIRPLFFDFPGDEAAWAVEDSWMFGPDMLVAPVLEAGARTRRAYLPAGAAWTEAATGRVHPGGGWVEVEAPLEVIPVFLREGRRAELFTPERSVGRAWRRGGAEGRPGDKNGAKRTASI